MASAASTPSSAVQARSPLADVLVSEREGIIDRSLPAALHNRRSQYELAGAGEIRARLERLYDVVFAAVTHRTLGPVVDYAQRLANERSATGHTLPELQAVFNALEEALWEQLATDLSADEVVEALTLVSSIFGVAKDTLACAYVVAVARTREQMLDLPALAAGAGCG